MRIRDLVLWSSRSRPRRSSGMAGRASTDLPGVRLVPGVAGSQCTTGLGGSFPVAIANPESGFPGGELCLGSRTKAGKQSRVAYLSASTTCVTLVR